jgi:hypothetical protein
MEAVARYTRVQHPVRNIKSWSPAAGAGERDKVVEIAGKMLVEYDRLGTLGRDIEDDDRETYDSLHAQLWGTPAQSIGGAIAKARVLDQRLRHRGEQHSALNESYAWQIIDDLLALGAQS